MKSKVYKYIFLVLVLTVVSFVFSTGVKAAAVDWSDVPAAFGDLTEIAKGTINCEDTLGEALDYVKMAFTAIRIGAVALLILFSVIDFSKAVASSDDSALQNSAQKVIKRFAVTIAIIILPSIINLIVKLVLVGSDMCGIS